MAFFQAKTAWVQTVGEDVAVVTLDPPGRITALDEAVVRDLEAALEAVSREERFRVVCIASAKPNSFAQGLDPAEWGAKSSEGADRLCEAGQRVIRRLIELRKTTVAWIQGLCLGAGLELALACDWRVSAGRGGASFGFTEMEMGLMPAWGGMHQLPNIIGLDPALRMLLGGKWLTAREALTWHLIDGVSESPSPQANDLVDFRVPRDRNRPVRRGWKQYLASLFPFSQKMALRRGEKALEQRLAEGFDAPREVFDSLRSGLRQPFATVQECDRAAFGRLFRSQAFRNLLRLRELRERFKPEGPTEPRFRRIALLGAKGQGMDLLEWLVGRNFPVLLREPDESTLGWSFFRVLKNYEEQIRKGTISSAEMARRLGLIRSTAGFKNFNDVDLVLDLSHFAEGTTPPVLSEIARIVAPDAILASTAPDADLKSLQDALPNPERVAGVRLIATTTAKFPMLELAASERTNERTLRRLHEWTGQIGKSAVRTNHRPGGLFWRIWLPAWNEAFVLMREGFRIDEIDQAMIRFGMVQGPLEHLDLLGLEAAFSPRLREVFDGRVPWDPGWETMRERGWMGKDEGAGFWRYLRRGRKAANHYLSNILRTEGPLPGASAANVSKAERGRHIRDRLVGLMVDEAKRCVEQNVVSDADPLDFAMMMTGWAPHRGGPLRYAAEQSSANGRC